MSEENHVEAFLDQGALRERWGLNPRTLEAWRLRGQGPKYIKFGRLVRYPLAEVEKFERERMRASTSDNAA